MFGTKTLSEVKAEVAAMLNRLPPGWLAKEIKAAKADPNRNAKTLEMLQAVLDEPMPAAKPIVKQEGAELEKALAKKITELEREIKKGRKPKARRPAKR